MNLPKGQARPAILFDLDGTLLPLEMADFERTYFKSLCAAFPELPPEKLRASVWAGTRAMISNTGPRTNREVFAEVFTAESGMEYYENEPRFLEYYRTGFQTCRSICRITDDSRALVEQLRQKGYLVAIATSPLFPKIATGSRLKWLGLDPDSFPLVTTFENSHSAKPNPAYYREVLQTLSLRPGDCIMIGNDVEEDGCARALGMEVFLMTDHLYNPKGLPGDSFPQGTMVEFLRWAESLPVLPDELQLFRQTVGQH